MLITSQILKEQLSNYKNINNKILRMVKQRKLFPLIRGLYETDGSVPGQFLAEAILNPSYLSFDFALSYYGLIPEAVYNFTSASFNKRKKKEFQNHFGMFFYQDVPANAFHLGIEIVEEDGYIMKIASPEKAICDKLYSISTVSNLEDLEILLFNDLRIDEDEFAKLNKETIYEFAKVYKSKNVGLLAKYLKRRKG